MKIFLNMSAIASAQSRNWYCVPRETDQACRLNPAGFSVKGFGYKQRLRIFSRQACGALESAVELVAEPGFGLAVEPTLGFLASGVRFPLARSGRSKSPAISIAQ